MTSSVYWIENRIGRLAIMARPRSGEWLEDEVKHWRSDGIDVVVSLTEPAEVFELGLDQEQELCRRHGMEFRSFPIADRGVPDSRDAALRLCTLICSDLASAKSVAIHCRAGIGRSAVIAALSLVLLGHRAAEALDKIAQARGIPVPDTDAQREWVASFEPDCQKDRLI